MIRRFSKGPLIFMAILGLSISLMSCSNEEGHWEVIDTMHAPVDYIIAPAEIASTDTLIVSFVVEDAWEDLWTVPVVWYSHMEDSLIEGGCSYRIWSDLVIWEGDAPMPPCAGCGFTHEHREAPPFEPGEYLIVVEQPDGGTLERPVSVLP